MKALVTGATGFIGSHLADSLLNLGFEVRCTVRKTSNLRWLLDKPCQIIESSFSNPENLKSAVEDVDYIFHVAGAIAARNYSQFLKANRDATKNLLEAAVSYSPGLKRFLHVSSQTVTGPSPSLAQPVNEETPCNPLTSYGKSKKSAEDEVNKFRNQLPITIIRPSAVYGPRDTGIFQVFKTAKMGLGTMVGLKPQFLSLVHSDDLVRGIIDAAFSQATVGKTYFVSSEEIYSWKKVFGIIQKSLNKKRLLIIKIPHFAVLGVAGIADFFGRFAKKPPIFDYEKGIDFIQTYWTCSVEKAKEDFGYKQQVQLEKGIVDTVQWYIDNKWM